jgi:hypothetical protein
MRRGPKPTYCYICLRSGALCNSRSRCRTLDGTAKKSAYRKGYNAVNKAEILKKAAERYRETHPDAEVYKGGAA